MGLGNVRPGGRFWKSAPWDCASKWKKGNVCQKKIFLNFNETSSLNKLFLNFIKYTNLTHTNLTNLDAKEHYLA